MKFFYYEKQNLLFFIVFFFEFKRMYTKLEIVSLKNLSYFSKLADSVREVRIQPLVDMDHYRHITNNHITTLHCPIHLFHHFDFPHLTSLTLDSERDLSKTLKFPPTLTSLKFTLKSFKVSISDPSQLFPPTLTKLAGIILYTRNSVDMSGLTRLKKLTLKTKTTKINFPESLDKLIFDKTPYLSVFSSLPPKLKSLKVYHGAILNTHFPATLTSLYVPELFSINNLPPSLTQLNMTNCKHPVDSLPPKLKYLSLGDKFNHPINSLPSSLEHLRLGSKFDHPINQLPSSLKSLVIRGIFQQPISAKYLPSLTSLELLLVQCYEHSLDDLPSTLQKLSVKSYYSVEISQLPPSLISLHLGGRVTLDNFIKSSFPNTLFYLSTDEARAELYNPPPNLKYFQKPSFNFKVELECLPKGIHLISDTMPFSTGPPPPNINSWSRDGEVYYPHRYVSHLYLFICHL